MVDDDEWIGSEGVSSWDFMCCCCSCISSCAREMDEFSLCHSWKKMIQADRTIKVFLRLSVWHVYSFVEVFQWLDLVLELSRQIFTRVIIPCRFLAHKESEGLPPNLCHVEDDWVESLLAVIVSRQIFATWKGNAKTQNPKRRRCLRTRSAGWRSPHLSLSFQIGEYLLRRIYQLN